MIYRLAITIPSEIFIDVDSLKDAETFIGWISEQYDKIEYPISSTKSERTGIACVKCLSIEKASEEDKITMANATSAAQGAQLDARHAFQSFTEDDEGPDAG